MKKLINDHTWNEVNAMENVWKSPPTSALEIRGKYWSPNPPVTDDASCPADQTPTLSELLKLVPIEELIPIIVEIIPVLVHENRIEYPEKTNYHAISYFHIIIVLAFALDLLMILTFLLDFSTMQFLLQVLFLHP